MFKKTINISRAQIQKNVPGENERLRGQNTQDYTGGAHASRGERRMNKRSDLYVQRER